MNPNPLQVDPDYSANLNFIAKTSISASHLKYCRKVQMLVI